MGLRFCPGSFECQERQNKFFKMVDEAKVKYICEIYDWDGKGEIDLFFLGDVMYALGLNITKKAYVAQGQTDRRARSSPSTTMSWRSARPLSPPPTLRAPTTTTWSSSSCTTRTATAP